MSRANWKGNFIKKEFLNKNVKKIWCRDSCIPFSLIGQRVFVHSGNNFQKMYITREKVGYKFGSFIFTRNHTQKIKVVKTKKIIKTKK